MILPVLAAAWLPPAKSTIAAPMDGLFNFILLLCVVFFVIITVGTLWFAWRYRMKAGEKLEATFGPTHSTALEIFWTAVPTVLLFVVFFWGFHLFMRAYTIPGDAEEISVTAKRWDWSFRYPNGGESFNADGIYVPVGRPFKMKLTSMDVLHSFFIPDFRVKMDCIPNRYTSLWFEATEIGEYDLFCTEYCGDGHSKMLSRVHVVSEEDYQAKLKEFAKAGRSGEGLYKKYCASCHSLDGARIVGPTFQGLLGRNEMLESGNSITVDENYLLKSIREPMADIVKGYPPVMPAFTDAQLTAEDLDLVIEFIKQQHQ